MTGISQPARPAGTGCRAAASASSTSASHATREPCSASILRIRASALQVAGPGAPACSGCWTASWLASWSSCVPSCGHLKSRAGACRCRNRSSKAFVLHSLQKKITESSISGSDHQILLAYSWSSLNSQRAVKDILDAHPRSILPYRCSCTGEPWAQARWHPA